MWSLTSDSYLFALLGMHTGAYLSEIIHFGQAWFLRVKTEQLCLQRFTYADTMRIIGICLSSRSLLSCQWPMKWCLISSASGYAIISGANIMCKCSRLRLEHDTTCILRHFAGGCTIYYLCFHSQLPAGRVSKEEENKKESLLRRFTMSRILSATNLKNS